MANIAASIALLSCVCLPVSALSHEQVSDDHCDIESTAASVMLLQQTLSVQAAAAKTAQGPEDREDHEDEQHHEDEEAPRGPINARMQAALPVRFMHLPKTGGTSFFNALFALPGVCIGEEPPVFGRSPIPLEEILPSCPGFHYVWQSHECLQPQLPEASGHFFGMFRQPEQRLISFHNYALRESDRMPGSPFAFPPDDIRDFFDVANGGMVYQLTHDDPDEDFCTGHSANSNAVTDADTEEAVRVISEDFAFVGITEQWQLSICLLHAMFGGQCTLDEFEANNPGIDPETGEAQAAGSVYDVSVLEGRVDTHDGILYEEALRIFERNLEEFGVTAESCEQGCWASARR